MKENFDACLRLVLRHEGGFVNNPADPGGMTNLGVTKKAWEEYTGAYATEADMRQLTPELVRPFYKRRYWDAIKGDLLPDGVDYVVFDCAVNSGPMKAGKILQSVIGLPQDGIIGVQTLNAVNVIPIEGLVHDYTRQRLAFLVSLPTFATFGKGWTARIMEVEREAGQLAQPFNGLPHEATIS
jgi:lysozyme family protein